VFVLVTVPPAAGKSTLSALLACELGLPRLAKDTIKDALVQVLGAGDVEASRRLGAAAVQALLAVAQENTAGVLDSVWVDPASAARLRALPAPVVEVFCSCPLPELRRRYRASAVERADGFDLDRPERELWNDRSLRPLAGGWPVVTADTTVDVDVPALAAAVRRAGATAPTPPGPAPR
jgi:predicted kinase